MAQTVTQPADTLKTLVMTAGGQGGGGAGRRERHVGGAEAATCAVRPGRAVPRVLAGHGAPGTRHGGAVQVASIKTRVHSARGFSA